jgi:hypothetical protein
MPQIMKMQIWNTNRNDIPPSSKSSVDSNAAPEVATAVPAG